METQQGGNRAGAATVNTTPTPGFQKSTVEEGVSIALP